MIGIGTPSPRPAPYRSAVRVSGTLVHDADLHTSVGAEPHAFLSLEIQPPQGLPYLARVDLGTSIAVHMQTTADLPYLRAGAVVSVAGDWLELRTDHGHAALRVVAARDLVAFGRAPAALPPLSHWPQEA